MPHSPNKKNFDVYFEIYGKKMKAVVMADNEQQAKELVKEKIIFHKVKKSKDEFNDAMDIMNGIIDVLDGKSKPKKDN
jgi:hypothetical protein